MNDRLTDYFRMGVRYVWVVAPLKKRAYVYTEGHMSEVVDGQLRTQDSDILVPLEEVLKLD